MAIIYVEIASKFERLNRSSQLCHIPNHFSLYNGCPRFSIQYCRCRTHILAQNHSKQIYTNIWTLLYIVVCKGNYMITCSEEKRFAVEFITVFLPVHIDDMRFITFDFNNQSDQCRDISKVCEIGTSSPVTHLILWMEVVEMSDDLPPNISTNQFFCMSVP